jgi:hypothetical protein
MRIAVYAIAKNEAHHVERWEAVSREADARYVLDTGSTDGTQDALLACDGPCRRVVVAEQSFKVFRFDRARNAALELIPTAYDLCIPLDFDEILRPGWRQEVERVWRDGVDKITHNYIWDHAPDGSPRGQYRHDRWHARRGMRWFHPTHESIGRIDEKPCQVVACNATVEQFPEKKTRPDDNSLLKLAVDERPRDPRPRFYLARDLLWRGDWHGAMNQLEVYLSLSSWDWERSIAERFMAQACHGLDEHPQARRWLHAATVTAPTLREPWVDLAFDAYRHREWDLCAFAAGRAVAIARRNFDHFTDDAAWGSLPHDLLSVALWNLGDLPRARCHAAEAVRLDPKDQRLADNLRLMSAA